MSTIAMAAGTIAFCLMTLFVIESSKSMPLIDAVIYKNIVTGLIFYAMNFFTKEKTSERKLTLQKMLPYTAKTVLGFSSIFLSFYTAKNLPLSQSSALFSAAPIILALLAGLILREKLSSRRLLVTMLGFYGCIVIIKPSPGEVSLPYAAGILALTFSSLSEISIKSLLRENSAWSVSVISNLMMAATSVLIAIPMGTFCRHPDLYIIIAGAMGAVGQSLSIKAYSLGNISTLSTVKFIQLPTMTFLGYVVYGQTVGWSVFVGGSLIFLANYMSLRLKSPVMEPIGRS